MLPLIFRLATSLMDSPSRRAIRATSRGCRHPRLLDAQDAATLFVARVRGVALRFDDDQLLAFFPSFPALDDLVLRAVEATWKHSTPHTTAASSSMDTLLALVTATELLHPAATELPAYPVIIKKTPPFGGHPALTALSAFHMVSPSHYVAVAALVAMGNTAWHDKWALLTGACFDVLEWVVPRVPETWLRTLDFHFWIASVLARKCVRGPVCCLLSVMPRTLWDFIHQTCCGPRYLYDNERFRRFCRGMFGSGDASFSTKWVTEFLRARSDGVDNNSAWAVIYPFLAEMERTIYGTSSLLVADAEPVIHDVDDDIFKHRCEVLAQILATLYPEHAARVMVFALSGTRVVDICQPLVAERFLYHLRLMHCPTAGEWVSLWKYALHEKLSRAAVDVLAEYCPPDIWCDDAHLCRYAHSVREHGWVCAHTVRRLFGHRNMPVAESLKTHPQLREIIQWLARVARKAASCAPEKDGLRMHCG